MRLPHTAIWDFNMAVRQMKRFWDRREQMQDWVVDTTPKNAKPKKPVPRFKTLLQVLGLNRDGSVPARVSPDQITKLTRDVLRGDVDWAAYGFD